MFAANGLKFKAGRAVVVHPLPHTAGMWQRSGDRQSDRGESAHERENEQQSGGQAMHGWLASRNFWSKAMIGYGQARRKSVEITLD